MFNLVVCLSLCLAFVVESFVSIRSACHVIRILFATFIWYNRIFQIQVTVKLSELKTTVDIGLLHRGRLLETIGEHYEQWNHLVGLQLFSQWSLFIICLGIWIILTQIYGICVHCKMLHNVKVFDNLSLYSWRWGRRKPYTILLICLALM